MLAGTRLAAVVLCLIAGLSCRKEAVVLPLDNTHPSAEALVAVALDALEASDRESLKNLLVTREEYEAALWPQMPDREYTPFDFVWSLNETNSRKGLRQLLDRFGGDRLEVVSIRFSEEAESYANFRLHPGAEVVVRRAGTGETGTLSSLDVFIEHASGWKLLNYDEL